jgi:hypothetical protein
MLKLFAAKVSYACQTVIIYYHRLVCNLLPPVHLYITLKHERLLLEARPPWPGFKIVEKGRVKNTG